MRWLIGHPGPHFSVHDLFVGWTEALRGLGEQVYTFNLGDRISFYDAALIETGTHDDEGHPAVRKALDRKTALETAAHEILRPAFLAWPDVVLLVSAFWYPRISWIPCAGGACASCSCTRSRRTRMTSSSSGPPTPT
jgi:hypothetical protein